MDAGAVVVVDAGNSRIKARCGLASWSRPLAGLAGFEDWLRGLPSARAALVACVAAPEIEAALLAACTRRGLLLVDPASHGVQLDVRSPELVGRDRVWAARGAAACVRGPALVVHAGTCLVVDAVVAEEGRARFLGGAIAPGAPLLARSLSEGTARLPAADLVDLASAPALGRDTREACRAGVLHALRGAARELCGAVARDAAFASPAVLVTGGDAALVLPALERESPQARLAPDLVLDGLESAARAAIA